MERQSEPTRSRPSDQQELSQADGERLLAAAREVAARAHSPYSKVQVGAALLTRSGAIFHGCNVENASYGLTICAERNAVTAAVAAGEREFVAMAIFTNQEEAWPPCGACRQVLHEFAPDLALLIGGGGGGEVQRFSLASCLPRAFGPKDLESEESGS